MSITLAPATPPDKPFTPKGGYKQLTDVQRRTIITQLAAGARITQLAKQYGVNPVTIWRTRKAFIDSTPGTALDGDWRTKLHERLPSKSVDAIERSLDDKEDVHKAAATGVNVLKGLGHLQGDNQVSVTVQAMLSGVPPEWRADLVLNTTTSSEVMPGNGAITSAEKPDSIES